MKKPKKLNGKGEMIYNYKHDILTFKIKNRNYKRSIEFQNFVADIDDKGFVTGVRILDTSKVFGIDKCVLRNIVRCEFKAMIENNVITITLKFVGKLRNKVIPLFSKEKDFTQQITTPVGKEHLDDSLVVCPSAA